MLGVITDGPLIFLSILADYSARSCVTQQADVTHSSQGTLAPNQFYARAAVSFVRLVVASSTEIYLLIKSIGLLLHVEVFVASKRALDQSIFICTFMAMIDCIREGVNNIARLLSCVLDLFHQFVFFFLAATGHTREIILPVRWSWLNEAWSTWGLESKRNRKRKYRAILRHRLLLPLPATINLLPNERSHASTASRRSCGRPLYRRHYRWVEQ